MVVPEGQPGAIYDQFVCLFREMAIEYILTGIVFKAELHIFLVIKSDFLFSISDFSFLAK